jgi:hypothetical protein
MLIREDRPAYRILATAGFFGPDDHLYSEGSVIYFEDEPNLEMEPMNGKAHETMNAYIDRLDALGRAAAEKAGRAYTGLPRSLDDAVRIASQDARRVQLVQGDGGVPLMGGRKNGPKTIEAIVDHAEAPEDGRRGRSGKLSVA